MIGASYGNVEDIEVLWSLVALIGLVYSLINVQEGRKDMRWLDVNSIFNGRRTLAKFQLAAEGLRAFVQGVFLLIGVLEMFIPGNVVSNGSWSVVAISASVRWGLLLASVALTVKSYLGKRVRDVLKER